MAENSITIANRIFKSFDGSPEMFWDFLQVAKTARNEAVAYGNVSDYDPDASGGMSAPMKLLHKLNKEMQPLIRDAMKNGGDVSRLYDCYRESLLFSAPWDFEQFMLFMEIDRPPKDKFYAPRQKTFKKFGFVQAMQALEDGELDELFLSSPPRIGKSTLIRLFNVWEAGKHPNKSNLYSVFSDTVARSYYSGILEFLTDTFTYNFNEVFPGTTIVNKNAQDLTINLGRKTVFPTITARSIEGALNGSCDCNNLLLGDDLLEGIEEAVSKDRLIKKWSKVDNNLLTRAKEGCKFLWIGTRWSLLDPIGIRLELLERDEKYKNRRYKVINIPALDEHDESNFDYDYGVGFSTEYYQQRRASFEHNNDVQSWLAQYMGQPVERSGMLFAPGEFRFYNGVLPQEEPVRRFMCVDPAFGGGDFTASAACLMYANDDIYIPEVVFSDGLKTETMPMLADMIRRYKIEYCEIEANKVLESYVLEFQQLLRDKGIRCTVVSKPANTLTHKHDRIKDKSSDIKNHMIFLDANSRRTHYQKFMDNVYGFRLLDDKQHDDAPDVLAMSIASVFHFSNNYAYAFTRRF